MISSVRIESPHFCAAITFNDDKVVAAAPILFWMVKNKMTLEGVRKWAENKKYKIHQW